MMVEMLQLVAKINNMAKGGKESLELYLVNGVGATEPF